MPQFFDNPFPVPYSAKGRSYRFLRLDNGILALIISDPTEDIATMSLSVATGHHADPDNVPGLAHLCEHMICVSSKEYPQIDSYKTKIHEAGGSCNAVTVNEKTSFFFSIPIVFSNNIKEGKDAFGSVLEVFVSYFKHPLFDASYADREVIAIDNEHTKNCSSISRIGFQGLKLLANPANEFHRFSTGNYTTLHETISRNDIQAILKDFFKKEYLPERIAIVLKGPQTLNHLQKLAVTHFSTIGEERSGFEKLLKKSSSKSHTENLPEGLLASHIAAAIWLPRYKSIIFTPNQLGRFIIISKDDSEQVLRIFFPFNISGSDWSPKQLSIFASFWCHILGSETKSSLNSSYLKQKYIGESVAKAFSLSSNTTVLELQLTMTQTGVRNLDHVIQLFFDYMSLFVNPRDHKFERKLAKAFSQFNSINLYNFFHAENGVGGLSEMRSLSERLLSSFKSLSQWFFLGSPCFDVTDEGFVDSFNQSKASEAFWIHQTQSFKDFVTLTCNPDNMLLSFVGNSFIMESGASWITNQNIPDCKDENFQFTYKVGSFPSKSWNMNTDSGVFRIPPPNSFAPKIITQQNKILAMFEANMETSMGASLGYAVKNITTTSVPELKYFDSGCQFWIKKEYDSTFDDKLFVSVELSSLTSDITVSDIIALELLCNLVKNRLREELYPALVMGYSYDIFPSLKGDIGVILHISGPKLNILKVLGLLVNETKIVTRTFLSSVTSEEFRDSRIDVMKKYKSGQAMPSHTLVSLGLMAIMEQNTWLLDRRIEALEDLDFTTTAAIFRTLFHSCYASCLVHGDIDDKEKVRQEITQCISQLVDHFDGQNQAAPSTICLPENQNITAKSTCKDPTNALAYFLQTSLRRDMQSRTLTKLLSFILSNSLLWKLRVQYQLGYVIMVGLRTFRKVEGIHITIMSAELKPEALETKVQEIIMEWYVEFRKNLNDEKFHSQYISRFLSAYSSSNQKMNVAGGPSSLTQGSLVSGVSGSSLARQHQGYWDQIINRSYQFSHNLTGEDSIDVSYLRNLKLESFLTFIETKILPTSRKRIKVSAMLSTECSQEVVEQMLTPIRLYCFLSSVGLPIKRDKLEEILEESGESKVALCKNLLKYYKRQGRTFRLITAGLTKLPIAVFPSTNKKMWDAKMEQTVPFEIDINHLQEWQKHVGFVCDESLGNLLEEYRATGV
ncbi:hypothetical protein FOA43_001019 [Brettanomyces nanus]|uniref:Uncharacterized protein n=1 Tax=Eeniella nana TaxID=13502 RepID=A0A875RXD3_EENNA|nr:uncharacterized protein FOA43_001019 [Brettanomyces nanus]QPG73706.1 hypothetical protein FOA43_001019 [Brettanomyces nanus]